MNTVAAVAIAGGLLLSTSAAAGAVDSGSTAGPLGAVLSGSAGGAPEIGGPTGTIPVNTPQLASVANFRDAAGDEGEGYVTEDGKHMRRGIFFRSNGLDKTSDADLAALAALGVADIYDLRGPTESTNPMVGGPDKVPAGAELKTLPIEFGDLVGLAGTITTPEAGRKFMEDANRSFVTDPAKRDQFGKLLTSLAHENGAQVFHCSSGKDRTGWTAMLLQEIAGLSDQTIRDDYLASNDRLKAVNEKTLAMISKMVSPESAAALAPVLAVDPSYLEAGLAQIKSDYGSVDAYLRDGLGLDDGTLAVLKTKLVV